MPKEIRIADRVFEIGEPSAAIVMRILNVFGDVGLRSESLARKVIENPSSTASWLALMATMTENDLYKLGSAVLQFEDQRDGIKFLRRNRFKLSAIVDALIANFMESEDLIQVIQNFTSSMPALREKILTLTSAVPSAQSQDAQAGSEV